MTIADSVLDRDQKSTNNINRHQMIFAYTAIKETAKQSTRGQFALERLVGNTNRNKKKVNEN